MRSFLENEIVASYALIYGADTQKAKYPVARASADSRAQRIDDGTSEIMKEVIARSIGMGRVRRSDGRAERAGVLVQSIVPLDNYIKAI